MGLRFLRIYPRKPFEQGRVNATVEREILDVLAMDARRQARFLVFAARSYGPPSAPALPGARDATASSH